MLEGVSPDIVALQTLMGGERSWVQDRASFTTYSLLSPDKQRIELRLPDVRWSTKDGRIQFQLEVVESNQQLRKLLIASTRGHEDRMQRGVDPARLNREDARLAWTLGAKIGSLTTPLLRSADPKAAKDARDLLRSARHDLAEIRAADAAIAADSSLGIPEPPAATGDVQSDFLAVLKYQVECGDTIAKALGMDDVTEGEPAVAGCLALGLWAPLAVLAQRGGTAELKANVLGRLAAAGRSSNLRNELWEPLVEKVRADAPIEDVVEAYRRMGTSVTEFLDAKRAESKPTVTPTEK